MIVLGSETVPIHFPPQERMARLLWPAAGGPGFSGARSYDPMTGGLLTLRGAIF